MGVQVQWDNPQKTILRYDFTGRWTWDEFYAAYNIAKILLSTTPHKVYFILHPLDDISRRHTPPNAMSHMISIWRRTAPNAGKTVSVGGSMFSRTLFGMASKVNPKIAEMHAFAPSLDEARALLAKESLVI